MATGHRSTEASRRDRGCTGWWIAACLAVVAASPDGALAAWIAVNDGGTHVYDANSGHEFDALLIRNVGCPYPPGDPCTNPGAPTSAIVQPTAQIYMIQGRDSSNVVVNGGDLGFLRAYHDSTVTMHDGQIHDGWTSATLSSGVSAFDQATLLVNGGFIDGSLTAYGSPTVTLNGGHVADTIQTNGNAEVTVNGGQIDGYVGAGGNARISVHGGSMDWVQSTNAGTMVITGGSIASSVHARDTSRIWIEGSNFAIDGAPVGLGDILQTTGVLTGLLANGDALNVAFRQGELDTGQLTPYSGTIMLTPEPGSGLLLGLGLAGLAARRRCTGAPGAARR